MSVNILDFDDYKTYLTEKFLKEGHGDRTYRSKVSEYIRCQSSYISQVLNGKPDFTLEQALRLSEFLKLDEFEVKYFIALVEKSRSGTVELKAFFENQLEDLKKRQFNLKKRLRETESISDEDQHTYYSSWYYSAVFVILSIPKYQTSRSIAERLHLPLELVEDAMKFLIESGLVAWDGEKYIHTKKRLHLDKNSPHIHNHHINWRSQSLQAVEKNLPQNLHYSTVVALAAADVEKVKEIFAQSVSKAREVIVPSKEEEIMAITLDVFKL